MTITHTLLWALRRELRIAWRRPAHSLTLLGFFVLACSLFPLAVGPQRDILQRIGPGVIWVAALLATLLALPRLFEPDQNDGTLDAMIASGAPLPAIVAGKLMATWLTHALPLIAAAPILATAFGMPWNLLPVLLGSLLLGTPVLLSLGGIAAALTLGLHTAQAVIMLLCLPLFVPVLVFGAGAVETLAAGLSPAAHLALLAASMLFSALAAPFVAAQALRISIE
jgi:heme exporter protein B